MGSTPLVVVSCDIVGGYDIIVVVGGFLVGPSVVTVGPYVCIVVDLFSFGVIGYSPPVVG